MWKQLFEIGLFLSLVAYARSKGLSNLIPCAERYIGICDQSSCLMEEASRNCIFLQLQTLRKRKSVLELFGMHLVLHTVLKSSGHILVKSGREVIPRHPKLSKVVAFFH